MGMTYDPRDPDTVDLLATDLTSYADSVATHLRRVDAAKAELRALDERLAASEARHTLALLGELGPDGKPRYSNEAARKAALAVRLAEDPEARRLREDEAAATRAQAEAQRAADDANRRRHDLQYLTALMSSQNLYYAGLMGVPVAPPHGSQQ